MGRIAGQRLVFPEFAIRIVVAEGHDRLAGVSRDARHPAWTFSCNAWMDRSFERSLCPAPLKKLARGQIQRFVGPKPAIGCLIFTDPLLCPVRVTASNVLR